ncbi:MAG: DMT family transporter [Clostridiales bacterium]|nr:DMT family transporter [Clostridiales bacterium]
MDINMQKKVEQFMFIMAIIFGFRVIFNKMAIENGFGPYTITAAQMLIGGGMLALYIKRKMFSLSKKYLAITMAASFIFFMSFYLGTLGLVYTTPSKNAFLHQTSMIFVPFIYYYIYKQKIDGHTIVGILIAMSGLALLILENGFSNINTGDLLTIGAAGFIAVHMTFSSFILKKNECDPVAFTTMQMLISGIVSLVFVFTTNELPTGMNMLSAWPLLLGGILIGLSFYVNSLAFKYSTPTKMSLVASITPVASTTAAVLFLNEPVTYRLFGGGAMILLALLTIQLKPKIFKSINQKEIRVES